MSAGTAIDSAIAEIGRLLKNLRKEKSEQVRNADDLGILKATSLSWFNTHRQQLESALSDDDLASVDALHRELLSSSERAPSRAKTISTAKAVKIRLVNLRSEGAVLLSKAGTAPTHTTDAPPDFTRLIKDIAMQAILARRWTECSTCVIAGAPLAATVMMGGLLEALLLARVNHESNKAPIFKAAAVPKDYKTSKVRALQDWKLKNFVDVAHELGWIGKSAKDVGEVLRDYRNYIHPYKEHSHGLVLKTGDAEMLWEICKTLSRQVIKSA
jgi:hypothetical protein